MDSDDSIDSYYGNEEQSEEERDDAKDEVEVDSVNLSREEEFKSEKKRDENFGNMTIKKEKDRYSDHKRERDEHREDKGAKYSVGVGTRSISPLKSRTGSGIIKTNGYASEDNKSMKSVRISDAHKSERAGSDKLSEKIRNLS